ncbi:MAG: hypothetical protein K6D96_01985 [Acetatifactor sp.]|nr:hypothetical protein [Acetatifactor sp.]
MTERERITKIFRENFIEKNKDFLSGKKVYIYGLSPATGYILEAFPEVKFEGLLDGFKKDGTEFGLPILSFEQVLAEPEKSIIIIIARKASEEIIFDRISGACHERKVLIVNVQGENLFEKDYGKVEIKATTRALKEKLSDYDAVSFDIFDTLLYRTVRREEYLNLDRLKAEFDMPKKYEAIASDYYSGFRHIPTIREIYEAAGTPAEEVDSAIKEEIQAEKEHLRARKGMVEILSNVSEKAYLVTDMYFAKETIIELLENCGIHRNMYRDIFVSCEYGKDKISGLFEIYKNAVKAKKYIHLGDSEECDVLAAESAGIEAVEIGKYDFMSPEELGERCLGPIATGFVKWIYETAVSKKADKILFIARDGYLPSKIYEKYFAKLPDAPKGVYFMTSRMQCTRAGMFDKEDVEYASALPYSGNSHEKNEKRFGVTNPFASVDEILKNSALYRKWYLKYAETVGGFDNAVIVDFVSTGTNQMYLQKILGQKFMGLYYRQIPDDYKGKKDLEIHEYSPENGGKGNYMYMEPLIKKIEGTLEYVDEDGRIHLTPMRLDPGKQSIIRRVQKGVLDCGTDGIVDFTAEKVMEQYLKRIDAGTWNFDEFTGRNV